MEVVQVISKLAVDRKTTQWLCPLLFAADAVLCMLILWKIPYTEIDWVAYMEQVKQFDDGERDYINIKGGTGPLVYPAVHLYIYRLLYAVTDQGRDIFAAQVIFALLYLVTLAIVMACYRRAQAPPYIFPLLVLSKRLHSVYLLRLFNDCFATWGLFCAVYAYQRRRWLLGSVIYSLGVAIKMNVLLALPAVAVIVYQGTFLGNFLPRAATHGILMLGIQVLVAIPFLSANAVGYVARAFDLTRVFMFKWTVNWRFVGEEVFLSRSFSIALLAVHLSLLALFVTTRWLQPSARQLQHSLRMALHPPSTQTQQLIKARINPGFVLTTVLTANAIGMLCARSLHYQFYTLLAWGAPFLFWRAKFHPLLQYLLWAAQEWAWNVYPSTGASSRVVVAVLALAVAGVWTATRHDYVLDRSSLQSGKQLPRHATVFVCSTFRRITCGLAISAGSCPEVPVSGYNVRRLPYQPGRAHLVCVTQTIGIMVPALQVQQCRQDGSLEKAISGSLHQSSDEVISRKLPRGPGGGRCRNILSNLLEVSFQLCHASNSASAIQRRTREM